jgi:hypothetical protein
MVVGGAAVEHIGLQADEAADQAAVQPQRHEVAHAMGGAAQPDILKAGQHRRPHEVVIAEHGGAQRQVAHHLPELPAVEQLPLRQMHIGSAEAAEVDDLAHPMDHGAGGQGEDAGRFRGGLRRPERQSVAAAGQGRLRIDAAHQTGQGVESRGHLLHEQEVRLVALHGGRIPGAALTSMAVAQVLGHEMLARRPRRSYPLVGEPPYGDPPFQCLG